MLRVDTFSTGNAGNISIFATESLNANNLSFIQSDVQPEATGNGGNITIETPFLQITDAGSINAQTNSEGHAGNIFVQSRDIQISGNNGSFRSLILADSFGSGDVGIIEIDTERLVVADGGGIRVLNGGSGNGGSLTVRATESIEIDGGTSSRLPFLSSAATSLGGSNASEIIEGNGGDITIITESLRLNRGGSINARTTSAGNAGSITIEATEVEINGQDQDQDTSSRIRAIVTANGTGNGGSVDINAQSLRITDGGRINVSTEGRGNGGDIFLEVDNLEVTGTSEDGEFISLINAVSETEAAAGLIDITANNLTVSDRALITVSNTGTGDAGELNINAENIFLDTQGSLEGEVIAGNQGNINLTSQLLLLRNNSNITTNAGNQATGGNITIDTVNLVALEDSNITANAVFGQGGNIIINAQGLFLSLDSDITASSEFGLDGVVEINTPDEENKLAIAELPANFTDASNQIVGNCSWTRDNTFYVVGRRGIAKTPQEHLEIYQMWSDIRDLSEFESATVIRESSPRQENTIVEANAMIINEDGKVELVAVMPNNNQSLGQVASSCSGEVNSQVSNP